MNNNISENHDEEKEKNINKITLEYLLNKDQYKKLQFEKKEKLVSKTDRRFYKKRILNLTKNMLINNSPNNLFPDVKKAFDIFMKTCIGYFKVIDEIDIIQSEINNTDLEINIDNFLDENTLKELDKNDAVTLEEADQLMMRTIKINNITMDKYVKRINVQKKDPPIYPKQININLNDPSLKNKGICKKNNINNN